MVIGAWFRGVSDTKSAPFAFDSADGYELLTRGGCNFARGSAAYWTLVTGEPEK